MVSGAADGGSSVATGAALSNAPRTGSAPAPFAVFGETTVANSASLGRIWAEVWECTRPGNRNQEVAAASQNIRFDGHEGRGNGESETACRFLNNACVLGDTPITAAPISRRVEGPAEENQNT